ncbi:MAG: hypothetical protein ACM3ZA_02280 [Bacillota bacterium]
MTARDTLAARLRRALAAQQAALRRGDLDQLDRALSEADEIRSRLTEGAGAPPDPVEMQELLKLSRELETQLESQLSALHAQMKDLGAARQGLQRLRSSLRTPCPEPRFLDHQA